MDGSKNIGPHRRYYDHLIPWPHQGLHGLHNGLHPGPGNDDPLRVHVRQEMTAHIRRNGLSELWNTALIRIKWVALAQRLNSCLSNKGGRWPIAFPGPEGHHASLVAPIIDQRHNTALWQCRGHRTESRQQVRLALGLRCLSVVSVVHGVVAS